MVGILGGWELPADWATL